MINNVKPGYVNPLTMVGSGKNKQTKPIYLEGIETAEKRKNPWKRKSNPFRIPCRL